MLDKSSKIYVAGHRGLVGSAIWNNLMQRGFTNLVGRTHKELDLLDEKLPITDRQAMYKLTFKVVRNGVVQSLE